MRSIVAKVRICYQDERKDFVVSVPCAVVTDGDTVRLHARRTSEEPDAPAGVIMGTRVVELVGMPMSDVWGFAFSPLVNGAMVVDGIVEVEWSEDGVAIMPAYVFESLRGK